LSCGIEREGVIVAVFNRRIKAAARQG